MKSTLLKVILVNLLALLALALVYPQLMVSPGPLIPEHSALTQECFACHTLFQGSDPAKCRDCHRPDTIGRLTTQGAPIPDADQRVAFHQELREQDCLACHSDHQGVRPYHAERGFSHALLVPARQRQCSSCHQPPKDTLHRQLKGECTSCHSQQAWRPATFDHARYFRFDRHHPDNCESCHQESDYQRYTCYGCHEHTPARIRAKHSEEGIRDFEDCARCHRSGDDDEIVGEWGERGHRREHDD